ncbi:hypothetical protein ACWDYH_34205 [Nocardia goodfellowii]
MSVTALRLLAGTFAAAAALTLALPTATATPATTQTQSETCTDLRRALNRAERELRLTSNSAQKSILETRIRILERQLRENNC